jgi:hypothetical protein
MSQNGQVRSESRWSQTLRLSQLFADPLRLTVLAECNEREMSPQSFHREVGGSALTKVTQAFELLAQYDWLERTRSDNTDPDAVEHFYRGTAVPIVREDVFLEFPDSTRALIVGRVVESFIARMKEAMKAGTICARSDTHITWLAPELDQRGWDRTIEQVDALFQWFSQEQQDADARMAESGEEPIPMTVGLLAFESPKPTAPRR